MKIVYNILATFNAGGKERVLANKVNYLAGLGYDVTIITTDQKNRNSFYKLDERVKLIDLSINYMDNNSKFFFKRLISYLYKKIKHKNKLKKKLLEIRADIVISTFDHDSNFLYKINDGSKKIAEIHFTRDVNYSRTGFHGLADKYRNYIKPRIVRRYDKFIILTNEDKNLWGNIPNMQVIYNSNSFESLEHASLNSKVAIAVGRYEYQKGFDELIKVWAIVNKKFPDWKLNIFGDGSQKKYLQNIINDLTISNSVSLISATKNIKDEYLKSSMILMTSKFEGLPMVLLEAQVCGLPIISYACKCGPKDIIINNENGFLINEGDKYEMATKIIELIENMDLRKKMGKKSAEFSKNFSEEKIMKSWIDLFNSLILEK